jgi:5-methylcytosine-specific restriction endonuclease McrA
MEYYTIPLKTCTKCNQLLPATTFFFHTHKTGRFRLRPDCKVCHYAKHRLWVAANREKYDAQQKEYRETHKEKQIEYDRLRYQANADKIKARVRQYQINNKDKVSERKRAYRLAHRDHIRQQLKLYYRENKPYYQAYFRQRRIDGKIDNQQKLIATHRRLARKRSLPDTFTLAQWEHCLDYHHYCCAVCGSQLRDLFGAIKPHIDHWIPLSNAECPGTVAENMICLCSDCNLSKGSKLPHVWLIEKYGKRRAAEILAHIQAYFASVS